MEIRVTTGLAKNKKLKAPQIEGFRAVQEIAKSSLFSIIGDKVSEAVCLDLFAGSGNLGIEALSRGAAWCDFVDENRESIETIKVNIINCGFVEKSDISSKKAVKFVANTGKKYDIIFMDPFYKDEAQKHLFKLLPSILNENGLACYFHTVGLNIVDIIGDTGLEVIDSRKFGESVFEIIKRA